MTWDTDVMDSTTYVFSDKLLMFQITALNGIGIGYYGASMGTSPRRDVGLQYERLTAEIALYTEDGANIMIDNGWLERPPQASDRKKLRSDLAVTYTRLMSEIAKYAQDGANIMINHGWLEQPPQTADRKTLQHV